MVDHTPRRQKTYFGIAGRQVAILKHATTQDCEMAGGDLAIQFGLVLGLSQRSIVVHKLTVQQSAGVQR